MDVAVRPYAPADLAPVLLAWEEASKIAHPFLTPEFIAQERTNIADIYMPNAETWVADCDGRVVAFIALVGNEVGGLFAHPEVHGQGVGRALMDKAKALRDDLEVEVFEANPIGRAFYAKAGFEPLSKAVHEETGQMALRLIYRGI